MSSSRPPPRVFVSYTDTDLVEHAAQAIEAINKHGWTPDQFKYWDASGEDIVATCLARVDSCDILLVLVAHRYGWVPPREAPTKVDREHADGERSIVRLEVGEARRKNKLVMPFLIRPDHPWAPALFDGLGDEKAHQHLQAFHQDLRQCVVGWFTDPKSVYTAVHDALGEAAKRLFDPVRRYQDAVREKCGRVALVGFGHDLNVDLPIEEVYVPIRLSPQHEIVRPESARAEEWSPSEVERAQQPIDLERIASELQRRKLAAAALLGVPGCGKSTALRRLAWACAKPEEGGASLGLDPAAVPVLLRLRTLRSPTLPGDWWRFVQDELQGWLGLAPASLSWLQDRPVLWLLDGLDEIADEDFRRNVMDWAAQSLAQRLRDGRDRLVVTSRDGGWPKDGPEGLLVLEFSVDLLKELEQRDFVHRWYRQVLRSKKGDHPKVLDEARESAAALCAILGGGDFSSLRLASVVANPLLLSILCLVHLDQADLPRRRAALYDKCLSVLLTHWHKDLREDQGLSRIDEPGAREVLKALAWWLQAERKSAAAPGEEWHARARAALASLTENAGLGVDGMTLVQRLESDSGVLVEASAGQKSFLHLTLQEYLAARHAVDEGLAAELASHLGDERWNEVVLLALSGSPRSFAAAFFTALLQGDGWQAQMELVGRALQESLHVPIQPFIQAIRAASSAGAYSLLRLIRARSDEELLDLAAELGSRGDGEIRALASEILQRAGRSLPPIVEPRLVRTEGVLVTDLRPMPVIEPAAFVVGDVRVAQPSGIALVYVPAGEFDMGSKKGDSDERPVHRVRVRAFWLAKHPVTNAEYARYLEATGAAQSGYWTDSKYNQPNQPVVGVAWEDAKRYCEWAELVLPSEAQWEYACRGGTQPTESEYWFGDDEKELKDVGWFDANSGGRLQAVAQKRPNPFGLFDVHGNVWEWCEDTWHKNYKGAPADGSAWVDEASELRVRRGGSFALTAGSARSAFRGWAHPSRRWQGLGFRPAQAVIP